MRGFMYMCSRLTFLTHWLTCPLTHFATHFDSLSTLYGRNEHNIVKHLYYTPLKKKKKKIDYIQALVQALGLQTLDKQSKPVFMDLKI